MLAIVEAGSHCDARCLADSLYSCPSSMSPRGLSLAVVLLAAAQIVFTCPCQLPTSLPPRRALPDQPSLCPHILLSLTAPVCRTPSSSLLRLVPLATVLLRPSPATVLTITVGLMQAGAQTGLDASCELARPSLPASFARLARSYPTSSAQPLLLIYTDTLFPSASAHALRTALSNCHAHRRAFCPDQCCELHGAVLSFHGLSARRGFVVQVALTSRAIQS